MPCRRPGTGCKASKAAISALAGVEGDASIKKLLVEIPAILLERSR